MKFIDLDRFISKYVTEREKSLFEQDLNHYHDVLSDRINNASILVIGGAGTIGSSFIKAMLHFHPSRLYVVDINENALTELTRDLRSSGQLNIPEDYKTYPMNMGDAVFEKLFRQTGPFDIVANFAAHKHVRSEKDPYSIQAMIENNVFNAKKLLDLLMEMPPKHFFCVSTDKAANPVNVMGASKKLMEEVIMSYSGKIPITTARFANVAFSNGSLLSGFLQRYMNRQPFSAPTDIKRYFLSPRESGQLCMLACVLGASGDIFFPKLSTETMKDFSEIGTRLLEELGFVPDYCQDEQEAREKAGNLSADSASYPVYYFESDTSGEKPFEEFYTEEETLDLEHFKKLGVIKGMKTISFDEIETIFEKLHALFSRETIEKKEVIALLTEILPTFNHMEKGKSLDQKM